MAAYSFIVFLSYSNLILLMLRLINMFGIFPRRKASLHTAFQHKQIRSSVEQGVEIKDDMKPGVDLISSLPCGVIHNILGRLHLRDIMKLSILSREWRNNCLTCPELIFSFRFDPMFLRGHRLEPLIHRILSHHQGPLLKFSVQVPLLKSGPEIDEWIRLLPGDTLRELTLKISIGEKHKLTSHICALQNLRHLRLSNCFFDPSTDFEGFIKLESLKLLNVGLVPEYFVEFIRSCPSIERLKLIHCSKFDCLEITGPKLKFLEFVGLFRSLSFVNCPVLNDVRLTFSCLNLDEAKGFSLDLVKSLSSLPMLEELHLQTYALEDLVDHGAFNELPTTLKSLKNLHLMDMYFEKPAEASSAIYFLRSCPNLENLKIMAFTSEVVDKHSVVEFLQKQEPTKSPLLTHLKAVKMLGFCGIEAEMIFVKFLLASARVLEEITIRPHMGIVFDAGESILVELKQYPRASANVEIGTL